MKYYFILFLAFLASADDSIDINLLNDFSQKIDKLTLKYELAIQQMNKTCQVYSVIIKLKQFYF